MRLFLSPFGLLVAGCLFLPAVPLAPVRADEKPRFPLAPVRADEKPRFPRTLLYPATAGDVPPALRPVVANLLSPKQGPVEATGVKPAGVFVRVVTRSYVVDGGRLKPGGMLGGRPFVFATLPEALYGRNLLQVFSALGYSTEGILTDHLSDEKVALVFRWGDGVTAHPGRDGVLPAAWQTGVYPATWDNAFALAEKMLDDPEWHAVGGPAVPTKLAVRTPKERQFLLGYPAEGKERIKAASYYALRETRGADWEYRQFLERSLSLLEHYTGDGTTRPTVVGRGPRPAGFPEFLGPNRAVTGLPEVAVIGLGSLRAGEQ